MGKMLTSNYHFRCDNNLIDIHVDISLSYIISAGNNLLDQQRGCDDREARV